MLTLYHNDMSVCAQKVRLALAEKGVPHEARHMNLRAGDQRDPAYLKLNPKAVVPTLVHDDVVVTESVVINEYIDDAFPEPPLKPADAAGRARMRWWTKHIDDGIFAATGTVSLSVAFHHQYTPEIIEQLTQLRGPAYLQRFRQLQKGVENPAFPDAIKRLYKMVTDMDAALALGPWLVGSTYTLADIAYAPYITRLDHLKFDGLFMRHPRVADWYERIKARPAYQSALASQFNAKYLPLMDEKGRAAWPTVKTMLALA
jgi:glutathione S-transferase